MIFKWHKTNEKDSKTKSAYAFDAHKIFKKNLDKPGFMICDESTAGGLSGASVVTVAGNAGWHTVLRTGSNKFNLAMLADRYFSGSFKNDDEVASMVQFVQERTDKNGQAIVKNTLPEMSAFETAIQEYNERIKASSYPERKNDTLSDEKQSQLKMMFGELLKEIKDNKHPYIGTSFKRFKKIAHCYHSHLSGFCGIFSTERCQVHRIRRRNYITAH